MKGWRRGPSPRQAWGWWGACASPWNTADAGAHALLHPDDIMEEPAATLSVPLGITGIQLHRGLPTAVLLSISVFPKLGALCPHKHYSDHLHLIIFLRISFRLSLSMQLHAKQ